MRQTQAMLPSDTPAHHNPDSAATAATDTTASTVSSPTSAPRVALVYQFTHQRERGPLLGNPLLDLLQATRQSGSISGAARQLGLSYRHVWGQLKEWEIEVGQPLILWDRGQAARLTPFADKLLRYKGMLWIDGEPNRLLFQGVQRLYSADWDRPWGDEAPHSTLVFIGINLPKEEIRAAFAGLRK